MFVTTLNKIRECDPCPYGWETLLEYLKKTKADDEELPFLTILESNGFDDALWCMRAAPEYEKEWRLFAVWCAEARAKAWSEASVEAWAEAWADASAEASTAAWSAVSAAVRAAAWDAARYAQKQQFIKIISGE